MKWLAFIAFVLYFILALFWFNHKKQVCCQSGQSTIPHQATGETATAQDTRQSQQDNSSIEDDQEASLVESGPVLFQWESAQPIYSGDWTDFRDSIAEGILEGKALEIQGQFFNDEQNQTAYDNLGLARANALKESLAQVIDSNKINVLASKVRLRDGVKDNPFISTRMRTVRSNQSVKEIDNTTTLRFGYNSTRAIQDPEVLSYLEELAERLKKTNESIILVGHTDDRGDPKTNLTLGLWRAESIKADLVSRGIPPSSIRTVSKGQSSPVMSNSTAEGRAQNRRVELTIIK